MKLIITPTYQDIFDDPVTNFNELIQDVPTELIAKVISLINAQLYLNLTNESSQKNILRILLRRNQHTLIHVENKISEMVKHEGWDNVQLFSTHLSLEFLHVCAVNYTENNDFIDTTPDQELSIFKAFLIVSESVSSKSTINPQNNVDVTFQSIIWPILIAQFQINEPHNYFTSLVKGKCLLDSIESKENYSPFTLNFIKRYKVDNTLTYLMNIVHMVQQSHEKDPDGITKYKINALDDTISSVLDDFSIDLKNYSEKFQKEKLNFNGFKDKPVIKDHEGAYFVIDWNFLAGKIYHGLPFDFYSKSGIDGIIKDSIFFGEIGDFFVEKYLFRKLIESANKNKHSKLIFDENPSIGLPDAYLRIGRRVFIFEVKDAFFGSKAIDKYDYHEIKKVIDLKFNSNKKGTGQLIKHITSFSTKLPEKINLKTRNLIIYPILIYTDTCFQVPGIMQYLRAEFDEKLQTKKIKAFGKINPLSFISIDFFIENIVSLKKKENRLDLLIDKVNKELEKREKRFKRNGNRTNHFEKNQSFEQIISKNLNSNQPIRNTTEYINTLFEELEINKGL
ncbi:MAG: hypothetical protein RL432_511 [Bacteroidota bacterium]|jgi:hypothetical protein